MKTGKSFKTWTHLILSCLEEENLKLKPVMRHCAAAGGAKKPLYVGWWVPIQDYYSVSIYLRLNLVWCIADLSANDIYFLDSYPERRAGGDTLINSDHLNYCRVVKIHRFIDFFSSVSTVWLTEEIYLLIFYNNSYWVN